MSGEGRVTWREWRVVEWRGGGVAYMGWNDGGVKGTWLRE